MTDLTLEHIKVSVDDDGVATVLLDKQIRLLPVVDLEGKLVGTISRADVCRAVVGTL